MFCTQCGNEMNENHKFCPNCGAKFAENSIMQDNSHDNDDFENRKLCVDGSCIGVIGADGHCKICRKPYTEQVTQEIVGAIPFQETGIKKQITPIPKSQEIASDIPFQATETEKYTPKRSVYWGFGFIVVLICLATIYRISDYSSKEEISTSNTSIAKESVLPVNSPFAEALVQNVKNNSSAGKITSSNIIGVWLDASLGATYTLEHDSSKIFMIQKYADGSTGKLEMAEKTQSGKRVFQQKTKNVFGEYYMLENNGSLSVYDKDGLIVNLQPVKQQNEPQPSPIARSKSNNFLNNGVGKKVPYEKWGEYGTPQTLDGTDLNFWAAYLPKIDVSFVSDKSTDTVIFVGRGKSGATDFLATKTADRKEHIRRGFSGWDGSHRELVRHIKESMHDPKSFEHVATEFWDKGDHLLVKMTFRGKNALGAVVRNWVKATATLEGQVIEIVEQGQ